MEKEVADRRSLAGMALAHADALAELRAQWASAIQALEASKVDVIHRFDPRSPTIKDMIRAPQTHLGYTIEGAEERTE